MATETFVVNSKTGKAIIDKDPNARLDYTFDWTAWLDEVGDTIASAIATVTSGVSPASTIAVDRTEVAGKLVTIWVSGGSAGEMAALRCRITTTLAAPSGPRIDDRTVYLKVKER